MQLPCPGDGVVDVVVGGVVVVGVVVVGRGVVVVGGRVPPEQPETVRVHCKVSGSKRGRDELEHRNSMASSV